MIITRRTVPGILLLALITVFSVSARAFDRSFAQKEPSRSYAAVDVILYGTTWCPSCRKARAFLQSLGVTVVEYNIDKDDEKLMEMMQKSGGSRGVPLIDVEGIIVRGFSEDAIRTAVEKRRRP